MPRSLAEELTDDPRPGDSSQSGPHAVSSRDFEGSPRLHVLVVDDDRTLRESCASILELDGHEVTVCGRGKEAEEVLKRAKFDIALIDLFMADVPGIELIRVGLEANPELIAIVITGRPSVTTSLDALRAGAWDYLPKPFSAFQLQVLIGRAGHAIMSTRQVQERQREIEDQHGHSKTVTVLGVSPAFRRVLEIARQVAPTDASVFVAGESGSGKELIAQFIHDHSRRNHKPLLALNCAALPEPLLESEMFGHCKGSFTGAVRDKPGLLEIANGGTMFLDEITEMSQAIQAKLLRVIQDGVVRRVGSTKVDAVVDVRFIAATNRDLEYVVETGVLRQDLYFRLRVVPICVPPLRERPEDVPVLANHFLVHYWTRHRGRAELPTFTPAAIRSLQARPWPGNVRELQNAVERAVVFLEPGGTIEPEDLAPIDDTVLTPESTVSFDFTRSGEPYHVARDRVTAEFERRYLRWIVSRAKGNMSKAARLAGIDRTTLYRHMEKHDLHRDALLSQGDP